MKPRVTTDKKILTPATLLLATGITLAYLGLDLPHTIALTVTLLIALVLSRRIDTGHDPQHHALPDTNRDGARRDLSDLTWAMHGSHGRVSERAHQRVRALAATALADEGIDLHSADPAQVRAAAARLGTKVHQQMTSDPRPPTMKVLRSWVSAIEHLADGPPVGERSRSNGQHQGRDDA
ncbi:hypothetical protein EQW78_06955 [Oerskovia turbata]|uniref:Uncharacterized protein n=1 Tax=Oerskovia turbata TaxID=1713 RepID=A0A4V1N5A0_9CELL|nr:hypothetical protein [Oerskovia turbata]RXR24860.1 hypothetical protein EQW73_13625 [Oerskovia turbata]RXR34936.1 hypothetical protein EQW78_06955 [Oerskovia turbata]TGJ96992.1 hypothetical protein DLJ96_02845 [Actinotalea fermentans ATCC 43279 = JCM 9966 = DSM 3133]